MKTNFLFIFAVSVLALAYAESPYEKFRRLYDECHEANAITPHRLCMNVKVGIMNANGDIDRNGLKAFVSTSPQYNSTIVDEIVAHCSKRRGSTPAEAAEALDKCIKGGFVIYRPGTTFRN